MNFKRLSEIMFATKEPVGQCGVNFKRKERERTGRTMPSRMQRFLVKLFVGVSLFGIICNCLFSFVSADTLLLQVNVSVPKCAQVTSATMNISALQNEETTSATGITNWFPVNISLWNITRVSQKKSLYYRRIQNITFTAFREGATTGSIFIRIRNYGDKSVVVEKFWGNTSDVSTGTQDMGFEFNASNSTEAPVLNGDYLISVEVENHTGNVVNFAFVGDAVSDEESFVYVYNDSLWIEGKDQINSNYNDLKYTFDFNETGYPLNISLNISGTRVFSQNGTFEGSNVTTDFSDTLNTYLASCSATNGICEVPFYFYSNQTGGFGYTSDIVYGDCGAGETQTFGGGSGSVLEKWNPTVYPQISPAFEEMFYFDNFKELPSKVFNFLHLLYKFVLRQPASLVDVEET